MNQNDSKKKKKIRRQNVLEALREFGTTPAKTLKEELIKPMKGAFADQIFGGGQRNFSGELMPGQDLEMNKVATGEQAKNEKLQKQLAYERRLRQEDKALQERVQGEQRLELQAIQQELGKLAQEASGLSREMEIAVIQAQATEDANIYSLFFLQNILLFLQSFVEKVSNAKVWLRQANSRAQKKNAWGANYKKSGSKYLLSSEHYLTRSAG